MNFYLFIKVKKEVHLGAWEHIVSLNYRVAWLIFTTLDKDKAHMTPHMCIDFWAQSSQGWIQGGAIIGRVGALLQRTSSSELEGYSNKQNV